MVLENEAPQIFGRLNDREVSQTDLDDNVTDPIDEREIFDHIRCIKDPEHPLTLEELNVVSVDKIFVDHEAHSVLVEFMPTISRCSQAPLIGLSILVKLLRSLPPTMKIEVKIAQGYHDAEVPYNKQLNDKERVAAAMENSHLLEVINNCLY